MIDRFDIAADRIEHEVGEIARMVRAFARPAIIGATVFKRGLVDVFDRFLALGLEGKVRAAGQPALRGLAFGGGDEQFVGPEKVRTAAADRHAKGGKDGFVKAPAGRKVCDDELNVVDQATYVELLCCHGEILIFMKPRVAI